MHINKRYIVDENGDPKDVVIPMEDYRKIEELLGGIWMMRLSINCVRPEKTEKAEIKALM